jgi:hypothetical protein
MQGVRVNIESRGDHRGVLRGKAGPMLAPSFDSAFRPLIIVPGRPEEAGIY